MSKKKEKLKVRCTHIGVWNADVCLAVGSHELLADWVKKNVLDWRKKELLEHMEDDKNNPKHNNLGRTYFLSGGGSLIWLKESNESIFVHELVHASHHLLQDKATPLSDDTEEVYAYLLEYLYSQLKIMPHEKVKRTTE